jgi:hypothetical protein
MSFKWISVLVVLLTGCEPYPTYQPHTDRDFETAVSSGHAEAFMAAKHRFEDHYERICSTFCDMFQDNEDITDGEFVSYCGGTGRECPHSVPTVTCDCVVDRIADNGEDYTIEFKVEVPVDLGN